MGRLGEEIVFESSVKNKFFGVNTDMMEKDATIYVAGHRGMVGSAIVRELLKQGYTNIITIKV